MNVLMVCFTIVTQKVELEVCTVLDSKKPHPKTWSTCPVCRTNISCLCLIIYNIVMSLLLSSLYCMLLCIVILFTLEYHFCIWKYAKQCDRPSTRQKLTSFFHSMLFWVRNYSFASWENKFLVEYFIILWVPGVFLFFWNVC